MFVCTSCTPDSHALLEQFQRALPEVQVTGIDCMSGCSRAQTVAFRAPGKTVYLFGDITDADLPELRGFMHHYAASQDGSFPDARVLGDLRLKALARIPG